MAGTKLSAYLKDIEKKLKNKTLRIGFLEGATYPDGTPVAYIAWINEFGATINVEAHEQTIYKQLNKKGDFNKQGKFVKKKDANFSSVHHVGSHTIVIPARPAFRKMIEENRDQISGVFAKLLIANKYDADKSLRLLGEYLRDKLEESYRNFSDPRNADSTIAKKGYNDPLKDTGHMINSISYEVSDG